MGKIIGFSIAGLGVLTLFVGIVSPSLLESLFANISTASVMMAGVVLVVGGIVFALMKSQPTEDQVSRDVPIYAGDKIVGYRRKE